MVISSVPFLKTDLDSMQPVDRELVKSTFYNNYLNSLYVSRLQEEEVKRLLEEKVQEKLRSLENGAAEAQAAAAEGSQSEWSEDEDGGASEPLLNDRESTGYTTDDPALENISMIHETGLTDAEGRSRSFRLSFVW